MSWLPWSDIYREVRRRRRFWRGVFLTAAGLAQLLLFLLAAQSPPEHGVEKWWYDDVHMFENATGILATADYAGQGLAAVTRVQGPTFTTVVDGYYTPLGPEAVMLKRIAQRADPVMSHVHFLSGYYVSEGKTYFMFLDSAGRLREETVADVFFGEPMDRFHTVPHYLRPDSICVGKQQKSVIIVNGREYIFGDEPAFGFLEQGKCTSLSSIGVSGAPFRITGVGGNAVLTLEKDGSVSLYKLERKSIRLLNERGNGLNIPADVAVGEVQGWGKVYVMAYNNIVNGSLVGWLVYTNGTNTFRQSFPNEFVLAVRANNSIQAVTVSESGTVFRDLSNLQSLKIPGTAVDVTWNKNHDGPFLIHVGRRGVFELGNVYYSYLRLWDRLAYTVSQNFYSVLFYCAGLTALGVVTMLTNLKTIRKTYAFALAVLLAAPAPVLAETQNSDLFTKDAVEKLDTLETLLKTADRYVVASFLVKASSSKPGDPYLVDVAYYAERARLAFLAGDYLAGEWFLTVAGQKLKALSPKSAAYGRLYTYSASRGHEASFLAPYVYEKHLRQHMDRLVKTEAAAVEAMERAGLSLKLEVVRSSPARCFAVPEPAELASSLIPGYEGVCTFLIEKQLYAAMALYGILDNPYAYYSMLITDLVKDVLLEVVEAGGLGRKAVKAVMTAGDWRRVVGTPKPHLVLEHFQRLEHGVDRVELLDRVNSFCRIRPEACDYALLTKVDEAERFLATVSRNVPEIIDSSHYKRFLKLFLDKGVEAAFEELTGLPAPTNPMFFASIPHLYLMLHDRDYWKILRLEMFDEAVVLKVAIAANIIGFIWSIHTSKPYPPPPLVFTVVSTEKKHGCPANYVMRYLVWNITWSFDPEHLRENVVEYEKGVKITYNRAGEAVVLLEDTAKCPGGGEEGGMDYDDAVATIRWLGGNKFKISAAGGERTWTVVLTLGDRVMLSNDELMTPALFYEKSEVVVDAPESLLG